MSNPLDVGTTLMWYRIDAILGRGGFGITYLATDTNLNKQVAIKEYLPSDISSRHTDSLVSPRSEANQELYRWGLQRFLDEARILARFKHDNIVSVLAVFEENNTAYMVMEYEKGADLESVAHLPGYQSEKVLVDMFSRLADGLSVVHDQNITHRDIKPANIFIRGDGTPVLLDFGSARQRVSGKSRVLTRILTKGYAPYEQIDDDGGQQGPWTDIYSIGATLYYIVSGNLPADSLSRLSSLARSQTDPFKPISELGLAEKYTPEFTQTIDAALSFEIEDRPQDIKTFIGLLSGNKVPMIAEVDSQPDDELTVLSETVFYSGHEREASERGTGRKASTASQNWASGNRSEEPLVRKGNGRAFFLLFGGVIALVLMMVAALWFKNASDARLAGVPSKDSIGFSEEFTGENNLEGVGVPERVKESESVFIENPQPAVIEKSEPVVVEKPEPTVVETPKPAVVEKPEPTVVETPKSAVVEKPDSAVVEKPEPAVVEKPEPAVVEKPEPAVVEKLEPVVVEKTKPTVVEKPEPTVVEKPKPTVVVEPKPTVVVEPEPTNVEPPKNGLKLMTKGLQGLIIALEQLDIFKLRQTTSPSKETLALLDGIASRYVSAKVSISGLRVLESQGIAHANISLNEVFRSSGESVRPGTKWSRFAVTMRREGGKWGMLEW